MMNLGTKEMNLKKKVVHFICKLMKSIIEKKIPKYKLQVNSSEQAYLLNKRTRYTTMKLYQGHEIKEKYLTSSVNI